MFEMPSSAPWPTARPSDSAAQSGALAFDDLREVFSALWRGKTTILLATLGALALAAAFVVLLPHKYTATTEILVDPMELHAVSNEITSSNQPGDAGLFTVESQVSVLTSDNVLRRVMTEQGLDHDPEFTSRGLSPEYSSLTALSELKRHVAVTRADRSYVVSVSVSSKDPAKAARIANAIAEAYLTEQTDVRAAAARQISQSLSARLRELQDRVRDAEEQVEAYKAERGIVDANGELVNEQQLANLSSELVAARGRTAQAKARLDQVESAQKSKTATGAFPAAVQSPTITALRSQYAEIMRREAEQKTSLGDRHPAVIEIEAQAARLQKMIEDEVDRLALSARTDYESAKADEDTLSRNLDGLKQTAITTDQSLVGLRELQREVQADRAVYEAFLVRARETGEQEQLDTKNIRVISTADLPLRRSWPPANWIIALAALMLGAAGGAGIAVMRAWHGTAAAEPRGAAVLPKSEAAGKKLLRSAAAQHAIPVLAMLPDVDARYRRGAGDDPHSSFAKGIAKVYEAVRESRNHDGNPSVLVIAADDQNGPAAIALTLAAAAASTRRVLLIDTDLKCRTLSAIDADPTDAGLVDVAVGRRELSDIIVRDRATNVNAVPFVSPNSRRHREISDADIERTFDKTKRFDMVIVAALNLEHDPIARFFAGLVDHIVVVARADEHGKRAVEDFVSRLGSDALKVRGAVLTGVDAS
jgi:succinoglycan biosynthesis transport protein ExoP